MPEALQIPTSLLLCRILDAAPNHMDGCFATAPHGIDIGASGEQRIESLQRSSSMLVGGRAASGASAAEATTDASVPRPSHRCWLWPPCIEVTAPRREHVDHLWTRRHPQGCVQCQGGVSPGCQEALEDLAIARDQRR